MIEIIRMMVLLLALAGLGQLIKTDSKVSIYLRILNDSHINISYFQFDPFAVTTSNNFYPSTKKVGVSTGLLKEQIINISVLIFHI